MSVLEKTAVPEKFQRFDAHQRFQHLLLALSVLMLIITGFPIKYGHTGWAPYIIGLFGGFKNMFYVHLVFAVLMLISALYHIIWLCGTFIKRGPVWSMMPSPKDFRDAFDHAKFLLGLTKKAPQFGRYTYLEKFEYFAVVWGVIVMGLSGLILWFPRLFPFLPRWAFDVARVVHTNEAFVAMLAIFIGHFFAAHFNPKVFPTSRVWIDGTISKHHLKEEHPLEYKQLVGGSEEEHAEEHLEGFAASQPLIVLELLVYGVIFILLMGTFLRLLFV